MGILFDEYTAPGTPQQNSIVERAFPAMFGKKVRAMMNTAGFNKKKRQILDRSSARIDTA